MVLSGLIDHDRIRALPGAQLARFYSILTPADRNRLLWPDGEPREAWLSFDRNPWKHPWLTESNLRSFRQWSDKWTSRLLLNVEHEIDRPGRRYGFVCNMANNLYSRAKAMRKRPSSITVLPHPQDEYLLSQPEWEEYAGEGLSGVTSLDAARAAGISLPEVPQVRRFTLGPGQLAGFSPSMDPEEFIRHPGLQPLIPLIASLEEYDALLTVQSPYLAYLSGKPYVATQMGGDIWYEASRDDAIGRLQRTAFARAGAFMVSNPWSLAFARRYGLRNLVYVPFLVDDERYSPGAGHSRAGWEVETGGNFFVLITSRQDYRFKGSDLAVRAFARLAAVASGARLIVTGWGADQEKTQALYQSLGILDKVHVVAIAGKRRLVDYLRSADCVLDQLTLGYFGSTGLEAMACGKPVVMNLNQMQYDALLPEGCAPVCQASSEDQVAMHLIQLERDRDYAKMCGSALRQWFLDTHGNEKWGRVYDAILAACSQGVLPSFNESPLEAPCNTGENCYHAAELAAAPTFPHYF